MREMVFILGEIKFIYTDVEVEGGISLKYKFAFFRYFGSRAHIMKIVFWKCLL